MPILFQPCISNNPLSKFSQINKNIVPFCSNYLHPFYGYNGRAPLHGRDSPSPPPQRGGWLAGHSTPLGRRNAMPCHRYQGGLPVENTKIKKEKSKNAPKNVNFQKF